MSVWLSSPTFNVRNTADRSKKLKAFFAKTGLVNTFPSPTAFFDYLIDNFNTTSSISIESANDEITRLKTENENLKNENAQIKTDLENSKLQTQNPDSPATNNQQPTTTIGFEIFDDPRLTPFKGWIKPEHKHPFDSLAYMKQTADDALIDFEKQKAQLQLEPLTMLRGPARDALMKWDREILMPALRKNTGILNLELTGEYKFLIMQDYCMADPIDKVLALLTQYGIIPADPTKWDAKMKKLISEIQDQQFPRAAVIEEILKEMALSQKVKEWATAKYGETVNKYPFDFLQDQYRAEHEPGYKSIYEANKKTDDTTQPLSTDETPGENGEAKVIQLNPAVTGNGGGEGGE